MLLTKSTAFSLLLGGILSALSVSAQDKPAESKDTPANSESSTPAVQETESSSKSANSESGSQAKSADDRPDFNSGKLTFEFKNTEWGKVIRWFADEAKLDLNMAVTPEGSFNYSSNGEFTLLQAMDVINSFLIREQGYILLRHANLIIVHDLNNEIPPTMIETIPVSELDNRGEYELTQTEFDVSGFDGGKFSGDIERLIRDDQGGKQLLVESSEVLFVRETGGRLRLIRKYLEMAQAIAGGREASLKIVELKYVTPEEVMTVATELIPLDEENNFEDRDSGERLKVVVQSFGNKFILQGTSKTMKRFTSLIELLDKEAPAGTETGVLAQPVTKRYPVAADRELILQVMRTMLAGTEGLRLALAEESGEIIAYAPEAVHKTIVEILAALQSDTSDFQVIRLNDYDADSMIEILNKMYGIADDAEPAPNQPIFMADPLYSDRLVAKAKPAMLKAIETLVQTMDPPIGEGSAYDKNYIQLDYRGKQAEMAIQMIQDMYGALQRPNKFNVVRSKSAGGDSIQKIERSFPETRKQQPAPSIEGPAAPKKSGETAPSSGSEKSQIPPRDTTTSNGFSPRFIPVSMMQEEEKPKQSAKQGDIKSVDGAPILIRENPAGLMIVTDDLKALAEIKRLLDEYEEVINRPALPTIVELKHRKAVEMKDLLEMFLGLKSSDSGGGGGGLGGMLGGMAQNAIGGMAGQMLGGLMNSGGGGDSVTVASDLLTGDVRIDADALKNVLLVQANPVDMETIMEYVNYFDTDSPEQAPQLDGRTYAIRVKYRDAVALSEVVKAQFPKRIDSGQSGGQQQPNQQAQQLQVLQQLMGRGRGGRGGNQQNSVQQSEPKMTIGVDQEMNAILVTGPEFLYQQVNMLVEQLDTADAIKDGTVVVVGLKNIRPDGLRDAINSLQQQTTSAGATRTATTGATPGAPGTTGTPFNPGAIFGGGRTGGAPSFGGGGFSGFGRGGGTPGGSTRGTRGGSTRGGSTRGGRGGRGG